MPEPTDSFRVLLKQIQDGSQDATRELVERYAPHVLRAVRRKLHRAIRTKFDSVDFVQAVWASFFAVPGQLVRFGRPEELIAFLTRMAYNKVVDEVRRRMETEKYGVHREERADDTNLTIAEGLVARHPSPSEIAVANEFWARLLQGCRGYHRRILELRRAGNTHQQIATQLGLNERTVRRCIQRIVQEHVL